MCAHIQNITSDTSYRGELEGLYRALRTAAELNPDWVQFWCDNKAAVDKSAFRRTTPGMMLQSDADIILAIHELLRNFSGQATFHHVYGHQDTRRRDRTGSAALSRPAQLNIECDRIANETAAAVRQRDTALPTLQPPYPGSKALLRLNGIWITSHEKQYIQEACHRGKLWEYCKNKYDWSEETMKTILWTALKKARKGRTLSSMIRSTTWMASGHASTRTDHRKHTMSRM